MPFRARAARVGLAGLVGLTLFAVLPAMDGTAQAAERTVSGGRLDWGVKESFQTYITGSIAQGSWTLDDGATTVGESQFRFHSAQGDYDPGTGEVTAGYTGSVRFTGHQEEDGSYQLDLTLSNPTIHISGTSGTLYADVRSRDQDTGTFTESTQAPLASLDLTGVDLRGGTQLAVTGIPATLTAQGATAFAGYYEEGTSLDPVTFTADTQATGSGNGSGSDSGSDSGAEPSRDSDQESDGDGDGDGDKEAEGSFADAAVDWGVRRTFREYVTGNVAQGRWELSGGARDGGAVFRFPGGEGTFDDQRGTVEAAFAGAIHFTGNDLDLRLSNVTVEVAEGTGTLSADVTTAGTTKRDQPLVTFAARDLEPDDGLLVIEEARAELIESGADAFGGLYQPGTEMDPVTLSIALTEDAGLPALADLGSTPTATATVSAEPSPESESSQRAGAASDSGSWGSPIAFLAVGAGVLAAGSLAAVLRWRRVRSARSARSTIATTTEETERP